MIQKKTYRKRNFIVKMDKQKGDERLNDLQIFKNEQFGEIRVTQKDGQAMFCLTDVCKILDLTQPSRVMERLNKDGVTISKVIDNLGREQQANFINESNLYKVIFQSRKPEAEKFTEWVTGEVLPSIRKHGAYMTDNTIEKALTDPDFLIKLATNLKEEKQKRLEAEKQIQEQRPKVIFADSVTESKSAILIGELAKIIKQNGRDIGQNRLFEWLRKNGYLISRKGTDYNMPTQRSMEMGLFKIKETTIDHSDGHITVSKTPKVTGKGQIYFINKLKAEQAN